MAEDRPTVIVTGSSGRIGSAVVHRFARDFNVAGFDRPGPPHPPEAAECIDVDLTSDEATRAAVRQVRDHFGSRVASVIHLAAYYNFSGEKSPLYEKVTVQGTRRMMELLRAEGYTVEQFLFSSTMLVHAPTRPGVPITEDSPLEGKWDYPQSKIRTEALMRELRGPMPIVMLRIAGVYNDRCHSIPISHQVQRIYEKKLESYLFPGDKTHGQSFVHLDDVVESIWLSVQARQRLPAETPLLIGEPVTLSYQELQHQIGELIHGRPWPTYRIPKWFAKLGAWVQNLLPNRKAFIKPWMIDLADDHYEVDITRARELIGWQPRRTLAGTLPKMIAALKADPVGWYKENDLSPPPPVEKHGHHRSPETYREG